MQEICSYGSAGVPAGNRRHYPARLWRGSGIVHGRVRCGAGRIGGQRLRKGDADSWILRIENLAGRECLGLHFTVTLRYWSGIATVLLRYCYGVGMAAAWGRLG